MKKKPEIGSVEFIGSFPIGDTSEKKVYVVTTLKFGWKYINAIRSKDGKYHSFEMRTSPTQKRYFTIIRSRTWGWFADLATAKKSLAQNWADMFEMGYYPHGVIEEIYEGILHGATIPKEWWYKWEGTCQKGKYKPWKKPKQYDHVIGFMERMRGVKCYWGENV